jgi:hypothetical protein
MSAGSSAAVIVLWAAKPATTLTVSSMRSRDVSMLALGRHRVTIKSHPVAAIPPMGGCGERLPRRKLLKNQNITNKTPVYHETKRGFS